MFKGRHFDRSVILLCIRWYLAYNLSLRNLEEMMAERGILSRSRDHSQMGYPVLARTSEALQCPQEGRHQQVARRRNLHQGQRSLDVPLPGDRQQRRHG